MFLQHTLINSGLSERQAPLPDYRLESRFNELSLILCGVMGVGREPAIYKKESGWMEYVDGKDMLNGQQGLLYLRPRRDATDTYVVEPI